ncbi:transglutaminase-like superfamily protein [Asticcacaulis biprosthecium C19]|uniref:Transglutaminase-like superfamily protein n=1 Tax=Asticcacaulis biprosthecium C19 TaxID=715226 RepID=F4QN04_9CAUL|nr:transglutaminase family protein [Asticcacaulis biprosthecium]EGF91595.1 transglutaminase-like superfamily protein [Asticcacaulis biprosthecium C19]
MTVLRVTHTTTYTYKRPVEFGQHRLLFRPRDSQDQRLLSSSLRIFPEPSDLFWIHDAFNNCIAVAEFDAESDSLRFETDIVLDHKPQNALHFRADTEARIWPFAYDAEILPDLQAVIARQYEDTETSTWARRFVDPSGVTDTVRLLETVTHAIHNDFKYIRRGNPGTQTPEMTLYSLSGTCRDYALLMIEAVRSLGFAARFVTGYIYVPSRDTGERLGGGATHAWVQVFLPGAGWVEFDPTNGIVGNRDLIRVGVTRTPRQAIPLWGTHSGSRIDFLAMDVQVNVTAADTPPLLSESTPEAP